MKQKFFAIWTDAKPQSFYRKQVRSLMTDNFASATIVDDPVTFWDMAEDPQIGRFKVYQATEHEIFKWKLKNEIPRDRL